MRVFQSTEITLWRHSAVPAKIAPQQQFFLLVYNY
jgi:hypothetical protein